MVVGVMRDRVCHKANEIIKPQQKELNMNLGATLTVQSNQTDLFTIIMSVINCASFSVLTK